MEKERLRLLIKVCQLYFQEGLNQQSIAARYGISRSQVSRMISSAKTEGLVEITIRNPFGDEAALEKELVSKFNLRDVIVVDTSEADNSLADVLLAQAGAAFLESVIKDNDIIGVMAGKSISSLGREIKDPQKKNLQFVPLVGGWGAAGIEWHANTNVSLLAKNTKGNYWMLHAPAVVSTLEIRNTIVREPEIYKVMELSSKADVAVIGIGQISEDATYAKSLNMSPEEIEALAKKGAVGSICTSFINDEGLEISTEVKERMIGIQGEELKKIPQVVGIARGKEKTAAIHASLKGGWVNVLITDMGTAQELLQKEYTRGNLT